MQEGIYDRLIDGWKEFGEFVFDEFHGPHPPTQRTMITIPPARASPVSTSKALTPLDGVNRVYLPEAMGAMRH